MKKSGNRDVSDEKKFIKAISIFDRIGYEKDLKTERTYDKEEPKNHSIFR